MAALKENLIYIQQKAKARTVKTQNIEYDLETLVKKVKRNIIKLDPDYQRRHRWDEGTSSRLIESLILNIPIPLIYLSQDVDVDDETSDEEARYSVIDGQQRLTAIVHFFEGKYALKGLEALTELDGTYYKDLPPFLTRRLEERTIKCLRIDSTLDEQIKYDIFERLNSGSVKLEAQELRNAVSRGEFNDLIKDLAAYEPFRVLIHVDPVKPALNSRVRKMEDVELVLRFFALTDDNYLNLKKGFKQFLDDEMNRMNKLDAEALSHLKKKFIVTMDTIYKYFGDAAFGRYRYADDTMQDGAEFDDVEQDSVEQGDFIRVSPFNVAVYDALTVAVSMFIDVNNPELPAASPTRFRELFKSPVFNEATVGATVDRAKLITRIDMAKQIFHK